MWRTLLQAASSHSALPEFPGSPLRTRSLLRASKALTPRRCATYPAPHDVALPRSQLFICILDSLLSRCSYCCAT